MTRLDVSRLQAAELQEGEEYTESGLSGLPLLIHYAGMTNIAEMLEENLLNKFGDKVVEDYETDDASREGWLERNEKAIELAKQDVKEKSYPWPKAANVKYPLITTAAIQFNARAYPAIINGTEVVKGQVIGYDPNGQKAARAERVGKHMSYQCLEEMEEWEEDTDKLLTILPIVGNVYRKSFFCPIHQRNMSKLVRAENLVYHYEANFETAPRLTECFDLYPQDIIEQQRAGTFLDIDLLGIEKDKEDESPVPFLEQHCLWDLDEDGYKEPYIVTVHKESKKVVRLVARYDVEEITVRYFGEVLKIKEIQRQLEQEQQKRLAIMEQYAMEAEAMAAMGVMPGMPPVFGPLPTFNPAEAEVVKIDPVKYYTKYGFIPAFDGSGYDVGLGQLLGPLGETINTNLNQMLDAGSLANLQGGFISKGLKIKKGEAKVAPNEWITVDDTIGGDIRQKILPFSFRGPVPVMMSLLEFLINAARDISSVKDTMTGESAGANEPVTTFLTRVDEGMKVFSAIYKRIHRSLKQEFRKLQRLNRIYLPDETYFRVLDEQMAIGRKDYATDDIDVIPVSDPSIATTTQKMAKARFAMELSGGGANPHVNFAEATKMAIEGANLPMTLFIEQRPQQGPDPKMVEAMAKAENLAAQTEKTYAEIAKMAADIQQMGEKLNIDAFKAQLDLIAKVVTEQENYQIYRQVKNDAGRVSAGTSERGGMALMEGTPDNAESALSAAERAGVLQERYLPGNDLGPGE